MSCHVLAYTCVRVCTHSTIILELACTPAQQRNFTGRSDRWYSVVNTKKEKVLGSPFFSRSAFRCSPLLLKLS